LITIIIIIGIDDVCTLSKQNMRSNSHTFPKYWSKVSTKCWIVSKAINSLSKDDFV